MAKLLGWAFINVGGQRLRSMPGAKIDLGGVSRKPVLGSSRLHGHSEEVKEATVECEIALAAGDSLNAIRNIVDTTVIFECDTGQRYTVRQAFLMDPPVITEGEGGKIGLKFAGQPAEES